MNWTGISYDMILSIVKSITADAELHINAPGKQSLCSSQSETRAAGARERFVDIIEIMVSMRN